MAKQKRVFQTGRGDDHIKRKGLYDYLVTENKNTYTGASLGEWLRMFTHPVVTLYLPKVVIIRAAALQNQQNDLCTQRRLRLAWASAQSDKSHEDSD